MGGQRLLLALAGCLMCTWGSRAATLDLSSISGPAVVEQVFQQSAHPPVCVADSYGQCTTDPAIPHDIAWHHHLYC